MMGSKVGKVKIYGKVKIGGWYHNITIEDNVTLNEGVYLQAREKIIIKKNSRISSFVKIYTAKLTVESPRKHISKPVVIEENVWIGSGAIILPGVRIEKNSIIGAGSVVTKNIEANSFYAGNPAKKIKELEIE